jgi:squalene-hopene/tetraprenyl-beta-curcumene cyclase
LRALAIEECRRWTTQRLNGEDGLGAIYPAMANSVMMYDVLGYAPDHPDRAIARKSVENLLVIKDHEAYCQPCVSPVWDTALVAHALMETRDDKANAAAARGLEWLKPLQVLDVAGDWAEEKPDVPPGGWAFQYRNDYYPDLDDTAVVVMAMDRARHAGLAGRQYDDAIQRGAIWVGGLQSKEWRLGRLRCRQQLLLSEQHTLRRSWRAAGSRPPRTSPAVCVGMMAQLGAPQTIRA